VGASEVQSKAASHRGSIDLRIGESVGCASWWYGTDPGAVEPARPRRLQ